MNKLDGKIQWKDATRRFLKGKPKDVEGLYNVETRRARRYLIRVLFGCFDVNLPNHWEYNYTMEQLFLRGYIGVTDTVAGVQALKCGYYGYNLREQPTNLIFAIPALGKYGDFRRTIGVDAVLWRISFDYGNVNDILDSYSHLLAQCYASIAVNMMNTRVANIGYAENKAQAETMKKAYDDITDGKPLVVMKDPGNLRDTGKPPWIFNPVKEGYICDKLEELRRQIKEDFLAEIGINTLNNRKSERMVVDEVNANNQEIETAAAHWQKNLDIGSKQIKDMFDIDATIKIRRNLQPDFVQQLGGDANVSDTPV